MLGVGAFPAGRPPERNHPPVSAILFPMPCFPSRRCLPPKPRPMYLQCKRRKIQDLLELARKVQGKITVSVLTYVLALRLSSFA